MLCDPGDVATEHVYPFQTRPRPFRAIVYDARPGGLGVAEELYHRMGALLREARTLLACPCGLATGCPACLHDGRCAGQQKRAKFPTSKAPISAVFHSFRLILGRAMISRNGLEAGMLLSGTLGDAFSARGTLTLKRR